MDRKKVYNKCIIATSKFKIISGCVESVLPKLMDFIYACNPNHTHKNEIIKG
jgi:hypothetical protein